MPNARMLAALELTLAGGMTSANGHCRLAICIEPCRDLREKGIMLGDV